MTDIAKRPSADLTDELEANLTRWLQHADGAYSPNTRRALLNDTAAWQSWCQQHGQTPLPASAEAVARFIDAMAETRKPATVRRYISSIATLHRAAEAADPTKAEIVKLALRRMSRKAGARQEQAGAITAAERDRMINAAGTGLRGLRDAALLASAYDTLCRRSELVALNTADIAYEGDGSAVALVRRSKTDINGEGELRYISPPTAQLIRAWLAAVEATGIGIADGPLFRALRKGDRVAGRMQAQDIPRAFKRLAKAAGFADAITDRISGHSTRVGAAQDMVAVGIDVAAIMQSGGWKTPRMVARYSENISVRRGGAARLAAAQGRTS